MLPSRNARAHLESATFPEFLLLGAHLIWKGEMKDLSGWGLLSTLRVRKYQVAIFESGLG